MLALFVKFSMIAAATFRLRKIRNPFADPHYAAYQGPLPHIAAGDVIQQIFYK